MDLKKIWNGIRTYVLNKYVITLIVFALIFLFVGEQSLIKDVARHRKIQQAEQRLQESQEAIDRAKRQLEVLQQTDSLERFAREEYLMHEDGEDVFLVE